jgi:hypothetical protein
VADFLFGKRVVGSAHEQVKPAWLTGFRPERSTEACGLDRRHFQWPFGHQNTPVPNHAFVCSGNGRRSVRALIGPFRDDACCRQADGSNSSELHRTHLAS